MLLEKNVDSPGYTLKGHRHYINVSIHVGGDANVQDNYQMRADVEAAIVNSFNREWDATNTHLHPHAPQMALYNHPQEE